MIRVDDAPTPEPAGMPLPTDSDDDETGKNGHMPW
jgi:hypothetical protein